MTAPETLAVFIPLTIRKRNGRPTIVPPADIAPEADRDQDRYVLKALARAWSWRRKLETGAANTIDDLARAEGISDRYVGRMLKLAYLAPAVLDKLLIRKKSPAVALKDLAMVADLSWDEQTTAAFE